MNGNLFREEELIVRKVQVGNEWQTRIYPVVGGRLRVAHEQNESLSIRTEIITNEPDFVTVRASVETQKGCFTGTGTASAQRDPRLVDALVELAETRAVARALRFAGIGVETGAEEISHLPDPGPIQTSVGMPKQANPMPLMQNPQPSKTMNIKYQK